MGTQPPFVFEAQPGHAQVVAAIRFVSRRAFWFFRGFGLLVFLYGLWTAFADDLSTGWIIGFTGFFAALGGLVGLFLPWLAERRSTRASMKMVGLPSAYRIDAEGVRSSNALTDGVIRWPLITAIDEVAGLVLVRLGKARFIPVPIGQLPPETREAIVAFLRWHVGALGSELAAYPGALTNQPGAAQPVSYAQPGPGQPVSYAQPGPGQPASSAAPDSAWQRPGTGAGETPPPTGAGPVPGALRPPTP
jgi:hypothetical protein